MTAHFGMKMLTDLLQFFSDLYSARFPVTVAVFSFRNEGAAFQWQSLVKGSTLLSEWRSSDCHFGRKIRFVMDLPRIYPPTSRFGMNGRTSHFGMKMNDSHIRKKIRFLLDLYFFLKWRKALVSEWLAHSPFGMTGALFWHDSLSPMTGPAPSFRKQGDFPSCHIGEEIIFPVIPKGIFQARMP